jgi:hypothetical protein
MKTPKKSTGLPLRMWRVALIRKKSEFLGEVEAPDRETAGAEAVKAFNLTDEQRERLVLSERRVKAR